MTDITYTIVEHDGGWAYKVGDVFSETFKTHDAALHAAQRAAGEQRVAGDETGISYEDERASGTTSCRPATTARPPTWSTARPAGLQGA
jgi:hypothetical protein